jgi:hypothetical protein
MEMKKSLIALFLLSSCWGFVGCNSNTSNEESNESEEMSQNMEETDTASTEQRKSPLRTLEGEIGGKKLFIQYGAPSVRERVIWGDLAPFDQVWRTGANEATYVDFSQDVLVEGKPLKAGKYSLFTIPKEKGKWTVIFNSDWDLEHGHFQYKAENDVLRVESQPQWVNESQEQLTISIASPGIVVKWEKLVLPIQIQ